MTIFRPGSCTHSAKYRTITPFRYFGTLSYIDISLVEEFSYDGSISDSDEITICREIREEMDSATVAKVDIEIEALDSKQWESRGVLVQNTPGGNLYNST